MRDENWYFLVFEKGAVMYGYPGKILPRHKFLLKGLTNYNLEGFLSFFPFTLCFLFFMI